MSENKTRYINEHPKKCNVITSISGKDVATADVVGAKVVVYKGLPIEFEAFVNNVAMMLSYDRGAAVVEHGFICTGEQFKGEHFFPASECSPICGQKEFKRLEWSDDEDRRVEFVLPVHRMGDVLIAPGNPNLASLLYDRHTGDTGMHEIVSGEIEQAKLPSGVYVLQNEHGLGPVYRRRGECPRELFAGIETARNELGDEALGDKLDANKKSLAFFIDRLDRTLKAELERCGLTLFYNEDEGALCVIHKSSKGCVFASKNDYDETDERYNEASFKVSRQRFRFLSVPVGYTRNHDDQFEVRAFPDGMPKACSHHETNK